MRTCEGCERSRWNTDAVPRLVLPVITAGSIARHEQPTLAASGNVTLRQWQQKDRQALIAAFADREIQRWHFLRIDSPTEAEEWITATRVGWRTETVATWAIVLGDRSEVVGRISLYFLNLRNGLGEVSYWVVPQARGAGLATCALETVSKWAFDELGMHRVEVAHSTVNLSSCRVATKAGFEPEGTRTSALLHNDGWHDMHVHRRIAAT